MDGLDTGRRRRTLKERLGFKGMNCCGPAWGFRPTTISVRDDDEEEEEEQAARPEQNEGLTEVRPDAGQHPTVDGFDPVCLDPDPVPVSSGMNLAAALAAERHYRASHEPDGTPLGPNSINEPTRSSPGTPLRMSLLRLLEEAEGGDGREKRGKETEAGGGGGGWALGNDSVCCVCMGRKKGAAFIPCGHTFCRACSRELWLNRGSCPLCNRPILEILDIF